jgi:hypothetical protein
MQGRKHVQQSGDQLAKVPKPRRSAAKHDNGNVKRSDVLLELHVLVRGDQGFELLLRQPE